MNKSRRLFPHQSAAAMALGLLVLVTLGPAPSYAEDKGLQDAWKATAELSYVVTGGNTSTSTFSLATTIKRKWEKDALTIKAFALRSNATTVTKTAVGTETDFSIIEQRTSTLVAENYIMSGLYEHRLAKKVVAQLGVS